jgi:hypothetical protein
MKVVNYVRNHWVGVAMFALTLLAVSGALLPTAAYAAPVTMPAISIPAEDILGTAVNVFTALSPILVVVAGLGLGMWFLSRIMRFFTR